MELDSQGRIVPVGSADQDIVSRKIADKNSQGQGQAALPQTRRKAAPAPPPEEEVEKTITDGHAIDILV